LLLLRACQAICRSLARCCEAICEALGNCCKAICDCIGRYFSLQCRVDVLFAGSTRADVVLHSCCSVIYRTCCEPIFKCIGQCCDMIGRCCEVAAADSLDRLLIGLLLGRSCRTDGM
jgi:hypothetical protein